MGDIDHRELLLVTKRFDLGPASKVIIHTVDFPRQGSATVIKHHFAQAPPQLRVEPEERLVEWTFSNTRRSGENDQTPGGYVRCHRLT